MLSVRMRLFMFMRMHHSKPSQADSQGVMSDNILYNSQHLFPWKRVLYVHTQTPFASHSLSLSHTHIWECTNIPHHHRTKLHHTSHLIIMDFR